MDLTLVASIAVAVLIFAEGVIAFNCFILSVIMVSVQRYFVWRDLRVLFTLFAVVFFFGGASHSMSIIAQWWPIWQGTYAIATCGTAGSTLIAGMYLLGLIRGHQGRILSFLAALTPTTSAD